MLSTSLAYLLFLRLEHEFTSEEVALLWPKITGNIQILQRINYHGPRILSHRPLTSLCFLSVPPLPPLLFSPPSPVPSSPPLPWIFKYPIQTEYFTLLRNYFLSSHHFMGNRWGNSGNSVRLYFGGLQNHCRWWLQTWNEKTFTPWKEGYDQPR